MIQEEKELFLKDLCARLPYMVKFHYTKHPQSNVDKDYDGTAIGYYYNLIVSANDKDFCADRCKLYLRPMSSMTEEEKKEYHEAIVKSLSCNFENSESATTIVNDWLLSKHFDVRGLIPRGLAFKAPGRMYNIKSL